MSRVTTLANRLTPRWSFQASLAGTLTSLRSDARLSWNGVQIVGRACLMMDVTGVSGPVITNSGPRLDSPPAVWSKAKTLNELDIYSIAQNWYVDTS